MITTNAILCCLLIFVVCLTTSLENVTYMRNWLIVFGTLGPIINLLAYFATDVDLSAEIDRLQPYYDDTNNIKKAEAVVYSFEPSTADS